MWWLKTSDGMYSYSVLQDCQIDRSTEKSVALKTLVLTRDKVCHLMATGVFWR